MTAIKEPPVRVVPEARTPRPPGHSRSHLRNDIVGGALTITFFVLVALLVISFLWQRDALTDAAFDRVTGIASAQEARVGEFLDDGLGHASLMATRGNIIEALSTSGALPGPEEVAMVERTITSYQQVARDLHWIAIYMPDLDLVATTAQQPPDIDNTYLSGALSGHAIGMVVPGDGEGNEHIVAQRIRSAGGETLGVAVVAHSMRELEALSADHTGLGETGETTVAQSTEGGAEFITPLRFQPDAALNTMVDASDSRVPTIRTLTGGSYTSDDSVDHRGNKVVAAGRLFEEAKWALVVKIDRSEAMAPLSDFLRAGILALILGSLLAAFLAWQVSRHIRRPIQEIRDAASSIAKGDRERVVPNDRVDEIGDLVDSFNAMTAELNLFTGSLEQQVADRTAELELKNNELRRLIDAKETFLAGVSHEVRGPLTAMMGFLELARDDSFVDTIERGPMLDAAMKQAEEVLILIEDLLAAARAESGTLKLASVRVNLQAQVAQVLEGLTTEQQERVEVSGSEAVALGDPSRARQVIRNLVTNAFRYGGRDICIETGVDGESALVVVKDNGEGIPEAERDQVFTAFGQSLTGKKVSGSVGIGLHVSRQLAELMSGRLEYDHVDGWSVFSLRLPVFVEG